MKTIKFKQPKIETEICIKMIIKHIKALESELSTLKQSIDESEVKTMHKDRVEGWHSVYVGHDLDGYDTVKVALLEIKDGE